MYFFLLCVFLVSTCSASCIKLSSTGSTFSFAVYYSTLFLHRLIHLGSFDMRKQMRDCYSRFFPFGGSFFFWCRNLVKCAPSAGADPLLATSSIPSSIEYAASLKETVRRDVNGVDLKRVQLCQELIDMMEAEVAAT